MTDAESALVENIIRARQAANMSQTELAKRAATYGLSFHQQTVQRIEELTRSPRLNEVVVLCKVLDLDLVQAITPQTAEDRANARLTQLRSEIAELEDHLTKPTARPVVQPVTQSRSVLTINEASERTGVPVNTLRYWRSVGGQGPKSFTIGRKVAYKAADIDGWLEEQYAR